MEWLLFCHFPLRRRLQVSGFDPTSPSLASKYQSVSLLVQPLIPAMPPEMHFFPLFLIPNTLSHLPPPPTAFVCNEKYPWKLLCCGRQKKRRRKKSKSHGSSTRVVDDIIATTELPPFAELLPDRARPAARSEGLRPRYHRRRGRLK